ncbi:U1 small nuclear ribonucleo protein of 70kDa MW N terminal-domain-containing protein, partial [Lobosporangium transversale]
MNRRQGNQDPEGRVGTAALPPYLLRLFAPRPPLPYAKPLDREPGKKNESRLMGIAQYLEHCKDHDTNYVPTLSIAEQKKKKIEERERKAQEALKKGLESWDPNKDELVVGDPYKITYLPACSNKDADGIKILGRRIVVDVERGRTVKGWRPKRLGGGLGGSNQTSSGRDNRHERERERSRGGDYRDGRGYGGHGDRDRIDKRRHDDRSRGGYSDRSYERDSKRRK